jgi:hypothetical protein
MNIVRHLHCFFTHLICHPAELTRPLPAAGELRCHSCNASPAEFDGFAGASGPAKPKFGPFHTCIEKAVQVSGGVPHRKAGTKQIFDGTQQVKGATKQKFGFINTGTEKTEQVFENTQHASDATEQKFSLVFGANDTAKQKFGAIHTNTDQAVQVPGGNEHPNGTTKQKFGCGIGFNPKDFAGAFLCMFSLLVKARKRGVQIFCLIMGLTGVALKQFAALAGDIISSCLKKRLSRLPALPAQRLRKYLPAVPAYHELFRGCRPP